MTDILRISAKDPTVPPDDVYRVMLVDDSSVIRGLIARAIEGNPCIKVSATAADGAIALNMFERIPADVIVLDIEMPVMDGLTALPKLLAIDPKVKIIVASTLSLKNAEISLRALSLGAADYIPKPTSHELTNAEAFKDELIAKILALGAAARKAGVRGSAPTQPTARASETLRPQPSTAPVPASKPEPRVAVSAPTAAPTILQRPPAATVKIALRPSAKPNPDIILIGSSTGGPQALFRVIKDLGQVKQPVMITQHMPPNFTTILAEHISKQCSVLCVEAKDAMALEGGVYYVAPGDYHMVLKNQSGKPMITINQDPQENFCRPAVDPMLRSAIAIYGRKILAVILTGMGQDGWKGCEAVVGAGGAVVAQDEATSVVWGMPGAVANAGLCSAVLPVGEIGAYVRRLAQGAAV